MTGVSSHDVTLITSICPPSSALLQLSPLQRCVPAYDYIENVPIAYSAQEGGEAQPNRRAYKRRYPCVDQGAIVAPETRVPGINDASIIA